VLPPGSLVTHHPSLTTASICVYPCLSVGPYSLALKNGAKALITAVRKTNWPGRTCSLVRPLQWPMERRCDAGLQAVPYLVIRFSEYSGGTVNRTGSGSPNWMSVIVVFTTLPPWPA
jgi:hypothetical protein